MNKVLYPLFLLSILICGCEKSANETSEANSSTEEVLKFPKFSLIPGHESGITFNNKLTESEQINVITYQYFHNGGGVALGDVNNDGLVDIYFSSNQEPNQLYLNKGDLKFENITSTTRVTGDPGWATGVSMVDINNDGWLDIYVCKSGNLAPEQRQNKLYLNLGNGAFKEAAAEFGLNDDSYSTQSYFFDYDLDGDLDMYLLNHPIAPLAANAEDNNIQSILKVRSEYAGDKLFENNDGFFTNVSEKAGISGNPLSFGLSAAIGDFNNDSYPDIYVCNDYLERDYLYMNQGDGSFQDQMKERIGHSSNFSMGSDVSDINHDGQLDVFVADMAAEDNYRSKTNMSGMNPERFALAVQNGFHYQYMINTLQLNQGNGQFSEISQLAGLDKTDWSWAPLFADFNNDGKEDLYVTNGLRKEARNNDYVKKKKAIIQSLGQDPRKRSEGIRKILEMMPEQKIPNVLFWGNGHMEFVKSEDSALAIPSFSNGAAYADLDNDGDLDIVVNNIDHEAFLIRNDNESGNYIRLKLIGGEKNKSGLGAKVQVKVGDQIMTKEVYMSRGYQSSIDQSIHFGLGDKIAIDQITVDWADGSQSYLEDVMGNQRLILNKKELPNRKRKNPLNKKLQIQSNLQALNFKHQENNFDDYNREVLLPHKMSNLGPDIAVGDVNGDQLEDFYICGAIGQSGQLFLQESGGTFKPVQTDLWNSNSSKEETLAEFIDLDADGDLDLYVGAGGNEYVEGSEELQDKIYINNNGVFEPSNLLPNSLKISTGTICQIDLDSDGDLDLFVGSRQLPGKYPFSGRSYLLEFDGEKYVDVTNEMNTNFSELGMITDSKSFDVNEDGVNDLIVCGEWMPIRVFKIAEEGLIEITEAVGLDNSNGWWYTISIADMNNDGKEDIVAGNLGRNYKYKASSEEPFKIYSGDLDGNGSNDIVLSYAQKGTYFPLRGRECSSQQMPTIKQKFPTYDLFASSSIEEVYGEAINTALKLEVYDFGSAIFYHEGDGFNRENFAHQYQYFNWNDMVIKDLNHDGNLDIIAAGNLFESEVETPRIDAGKGLILYGNGKGGFERANTETTNWGSNNVKSLKSIMVDNKEGFLIANNNDLLNLLTLDNSIDQ